MVKTGVYAGICNYARFEQDFTTNTVFINLRACQAKAVARGFRKFSTWS